MESGFILGTTDRGEDGDGGMAVAAEKGDEGSLGIDGGGGVGMI